MSDCRCATCGTCRQDHNGWHHQWEAKAPSHPNRDALLNLVARAERGALLDGEAQILRDAIELLDESIATLMVIAGGQKEAG